MAQSILRAVVRAADALGEDIASATLPTEFLDVGVSWEPGNETFTLTLNAVSVTQGINDPLQPIEEGAAAIPVVTGISPTSPGTSAGDPVTWPSTQSYTLQYDDNGYEGTIYFRSIDPFPTWIFISDSTEPNTAVASSLGVEAPAEAEQHTVYLYASTNADAGDDASGGSSIEDPFEVTFYIEYPD